MVQNQKDRNIFTCLRQFVQDSLLTKNSNLKYDDPITIKIETFSPTTDRLIVLRQLQILHLSFPEHTANVLSHELQNHTLEKNI